MAKKHVKKYSKFLAIKEIQIKTTWGFPVIPVGMVIKNMGGELSMQKWIQNIYTSYNHYYKGTRVEKRKIEDINQFKL
jgi:hypothetical protein